MLKRIDPDEKSIKELYGEYLNKWVLDYERGMLRFDEIPGFWSRCSLLYAMYKELTSLIGPAGDTLMARVTKPHGVTFLTFLKDMKGELPRDDILKLIATDLLATGWGRVYIEDDSPHEIRVIAPKGFPLAQQFKLHDDKSTHPVDYYFLGYFQGALSTLDDVNYDASEIKCVAKGDDECVFVFRNRDCDSGRGMGGR